MSLSRGKDDEPVNKELEKLKKENEELRHQNLKLTVENAFIKKLDALVQKRKPTKTEIAQAVRELRLELGLGVKTILSILNDPNNALPSLSRSNYYNILKREDQDEIKHHSLIKRIKEIFFELKDRYTAPGYRTITDHLHS